MALKKKKNMKNGLQLEYHRISSVYIVPNKYINITLSSYLNEEARQNEKDYESGKIKENYFSPYVAQESINLEFAENILLMLGNPLVCAYALLKKHCKEFADAEDV